jgi:hypothetical protein
MTDFLGPFNSGAAVGSNGSATANTTTAQPINGFVMGVYVKYNDSCPSTTDIVIATSGAQAPAETILTLTDKNTSGWFYPRYTAQTQLGVDISTTNTQYPILCDTVTVTISGSNAADNVDVWFKVIS